MPRLPLRPRPTLAEARATLTDPAAHNAHPAVIQAAWAQLVAARGGTFHPDRLARAHHLVAPASPTGPSGTAPTDTINAIAATQARTLPRIRARIAALARRPGAPADPGPTPGPEAA